jgi:hypothetical protein
MKQLIKAAATFGFLWAVATNTGLGQQTNIFVDEFGNGSFSAVPNTSVPLGFTVGPDPTGGVTGNVLIYSLPLLISPGDIGLVEPGSPTGSGPSDLLRFFTPSGSGTSELIFYSDISPGDPSDSFADSGLPSSPNAVLVDESGPEGNNGAVFAAVNNAPGGGPFGSEVIYHVVSDAPEPGTAALLLAGAGVGLGVHRFRRRASR